MRTLPLLLSLAALTSPAWALEETDFRFHLDLLLNQEYEVSIGEFDFEPEFDHAIGFRAQLVQPLNVLETGELISVIGAGYMDAIDDDFVDSGIQLKYQAWTFHYGLGYRAELGPLDLDMYPYAGLGWVSYEFGRDSDPALIMEFGAQVDLAFTGDSWQFGLGAGWRYRSSDHFLGSTDHSVVHTSPSVNAFVGYRF